MKPALPRIVTATTVTQSIDGQQKGRFRKEIVSVPIPGGEICMVRKRAAGNQPTRGAVVLIHGFGQNRYSWHLRRRSFVNYLAGEGFDVFNLELRGHGRSRAGSPHPSRFEDYVEGDALAGIDAAAALSGHRKVFVAGHSLGAAVAFAAAGHAPGKIAGVISLAGVFQFGVGQPIFKWASRAYKLGAWWIDPIVHLAPYVPVDLAGRMLVAARRVFDHRAFARSPLQVWHPGSVEPKVLAERMTRGMDRTSMGVLRQMIEWAATGEFVGMQSRRDFAAAFARADVPLLVVAADHDRLCTPRDCQSAYEASRSRDKSYLEFGPVQGGEHWGHVDLVCGVRAPAWVWPELAGWMADRAAAKRKR
jgi:alpha-beta hydrolase superfamily lysophospholipase